jgi:3-oxoacyl-[acyl-carrier-protein] synthase-3
MSCAPDLLVHLLNRLEQVRRELGYEPLAGTDGQVAFAEALDSMGMVEFVGLIAADCGVVPEQVERVVGNRFSTVADLAAALTRAGLSARQQWERPELSPVGTRSLVPARPSGWICATAIGLPRQIQTAGELNALLGRPPGWLERHAGNASRHVWGDEDALAVAAATGVRCLELAGVTAQDLEALLITSEAPPVPTGLAAAIHHRMGLPADTTALEIGGACTGFLAALWTARRLLSEAAMVLIVAVEAATRWLQVRPGPAGETAALFGDGAAACLVGAEPRGGAAVPLLDLRLGTDGSESRLLQVHPAGNGVEIMMEGLALASRAADTLARTVAELLVRHGLAAHDLAGVAVHAGNGRLPALLARQLGLPLEKVWSETARTGNLGSASLPVAWTVHGRAGPGPVVWAAFGAGVQWGAALLGTSPETTRGLGRGLCV